MIVDEAQRVKNWNTIAARALKRIDSPYSKADRDDLDGKQQNALHAVTKEIVETYGRQRPVRRRK